MRAAVYGGIRYDMRLAMGGQIGVSQDGLALRDGLSPERFDFGVGSDPGGNFVFVRTLVAPEHRGGYPLTVIVDPGVDLWSELGWNGAWLAHWWLEMESLVARWTDPKPASEVSPDEVRTAVLRAVEGYGSWKQRTADSSAARSDENTQGFLDALVEGTFSENPSPTVSLESIGLGDWPTPLIAAGWMEDLPPTFRVGLGWGFSEATTVRRVFGAKVLLRSGGGRDGLPSESGSEWKEGSRIRRLFEAAVHSGTHGECVQALLAAPMSAWRPPPPTCLTLLSHLERVQGPFVEASALEALQFAVDRVEAESPLDQVLRKRLIETWSSGDEPIEGAAAGGLVHLGRAKSLELSSQILGRLGPEAADNLAALGWPVKPIGTTSQWDLSEPVLGRLVAIWPEPLEIPTVIQKLVEVGAGRAISRAVLRTAVRRFLESGGEPRMCTVASGPETLQADLRWVLTNEANEAARKAAPGWEHLWLCAGDPDTLDSLESNWGRTTHFLALVFKALEECGGEGGESIRERVNALAYSKHADLLERSIVEGMADHFGGGWETRAFVLGVLEGRRPRRTRKRPAPDLQEVERFSGLLWARVAVLPQRLRHRALQRLADAVDELPVPLARELRKLDRSRGALAWLRRLWKG